MLRPRHPHLGLLLFTCIAAPWLAVSSLRAQDPDEEEETGEETSPATQTTPAPPDAGTPAPEAAPANPATPGKPAEAPKPTPEQLAQKLVQEIMQTKIQRTPSAMLRAESGMEDPVEAEKPGPKFSKQVLSGDWAGIKEMLKGIPEADARKVFLHLVQQLQSPLQMQREARRNNTGKQDFPVVLPTEIIALAESLPAELKEPEIKALAALLQRSVGDGYPTNAMLAMLKTGNSVMGGSDPAKRLVAAKLLAGANIPEAAATFLPPLAEASEKKDGEAMLIHAKAILAQAQEDNSDAAKLDSWKVVLDVLAIANLKPPIQNAALQQCLGLMEEVPAEARKQFLKKIITDTPPLAKAMVAAAADRQGGMTSQGDANQRSQGLRLLSEMAGIAIKDVPAEVKAAWVPTLSRMALPWLDEAASVNAKPNDMNQGGYYDEYGNYISQGSRVVYRNGQRVVENPSAEREATAKKLFELAPNEEWMGLLEASVQQRIVTTLPKVAIAAEKEDAMLGYLQSMSKTDPKATAGMVAQYLQDWGQKRNPSQHSMRNRYNRYYYGGMMSYYGQQQQQGIPITRALQERNVSELAVLLGEIRKLPIPQPDPDVLANTFTAMHSQAEVFQTEDITKVFGAPDKIDSRVLSSLIDTMRQRLATVWRQQKTQDAARTKRTEQETNAEVQRGYDVSTTLADGAVSAAPEDWRFHMTRAALAYDWAEFKYGQKEDLKHYSAKRDQAFDGFVKAAEIYAKKVPGLKPKDYDIGAYAFWFNASLGASDLSNVTRQQLPSSKRLEAIRTAILALPGEAAAKHMDMFAANLNGGVQSLQAHLKQPYVDAALIVLGKDHPMAQEALELQRFYQEVGSEVEFVSQVDGPTAVGTQPFGLVYSLRYTQGVGREADGFRKFLTNQTQNQGFYYGMQSNQPPQDYRDQFEKQINTVLAENFQILGITFADAKDPYRLYGREGWRETGYAYVLLKAKQPTVDTIPAVKLDLDFSDQFGLVLLPKTTSALAVDCRESSLRPNKDLAITQILDQRDSAKGIFTLEIKATGQGVIPDLTQLTELNFEGLKLKDIVDPGMTLNKVASTEAGITVQAERNWIVNLELADKVRPTQFVFPTMKLPANVTLKSYNDADLVDATPVVPVAALPRQTIQGWIKANPKPTAAIAGGILAFFALLYGLIKFIRRPRVAQIPRHKLPQQATAFNVLTLLKNLEKDSELKLKEPQREELRQLIQEMEQAHFAKSNAPAAATDLKPLASKWLGLAGIRA